MMLNKFKVVILYLLVITSTTNYLFSQTATNSKPIPKNEKDPFVIDSVIYNKKKNELDDKNQGRTKESRLIEAFGDMRQLGFADIDKLIKYLTDIDQDIEEQRLFASHSVTIKSLKKVGNQTLVEVEMMVEDAIPYALIPYADYSSSEGLSFAGANIFSNVGGDLFNLLIEGVVFIPTSENRLIWSTPNFNAVVNFDNVQISKDLKFNNETTLGFANNYVSDKGSVNFAYNNLEIKNDTSLNWEAMPDLFFNTKLNLYYTGNVEITSDVNSTKDYGSSYKFYFNPAVELDYNKAPWVGKARKGYGIKTEVGYLLNETIKNPDHYNHDMVFQNKIGYFGQPTKWFFPEISSTIYYKSGLPEYDLGRFVSGIPDGNMSGNGGIFINSAYMFKILRVKRTMEVQMGPVIGYAATIDNSRDFERDDQGFSVGIRGVVYFDQLPSIPFYITLGVDLRDGINSSNLGSRIELDLTTKHYF